MYNVSIKIITFMHILNEVQLLLEGPFSDYKIEEGMAVITYYSKCPDRIYIKKEIYNRSDS